MQFIFVNYFFIWVLPVVALRAALVLKLSMNLTLFTAELPNMNSFVLKLWPHKERNINSMHYHEEWMFALVNKCVLITE